MSIRHYNLLAVCIFVLICVGTYYTRIAPVVPVALLAFAGLTGVAFQLEDGKLARMFKEILSAFHNDRAHHVH
jgi:hypothetical protein